MKMTKRMDGIYAKKVFYTFPATNTKTLVKETLKAGERPPASGTFKYKGATYFPPPDHEVEVRFFLQPAK